MEKEFEQLNSKITQCLTELFDTKLQMKDIIQMFFYQVISQPQYFAQD